MADPGKLTFLSPLRYERIAIKGTVAFSVAAFGIQSITIPHNLGYTPYFKVWYAYTDGKVFNYFTGPGSFGIDGNGGQADSTNYADNTNLYLAISENSGAPISGSIYYRIYAEQVA